MQLILDSLIIMKIKLEKSILILVLGQFSKGHFDHEHLDNRYLPNIPIHIDTP